MEANTIKILNFIQLAMIFTTGFLISRVFIKCGIAEKIVFFFIKKSHGHISRIIIYLVFTTAIISMFIPNVISVLAVLPMIGILMKDLKSIDHPDKPLNTSLAMASLYGANIGGTGSMTGSPAHVIFLGFIISRQIPGFEKFDYLSWLGWGFPFVFIYCAFACVIIMYLLIPKDLRKMKIDFEHLHKHNTDYPHQKICLIISISTFVFWMLISAINMIDKTTMMPVTTIISSVFFISFIFLIFFKDIFDRSHNVKSKILKFKDCYSNLPGKGFLIIMIIVVLSVVLINILQIDKKLVFFAEKLIPDSASPLVLMLVFATLTVFISEFISNTATAISFFIIAYTSCQIMNINPLPILLGISVVSIVPSMTPIASPVNAMAFGGVKGVSFKKMFRTGFFMDLVGIILVTILALYVIPWYYNIG